MSETKPRLIRLAAILTQLQSKRIVTARDIADKHDVSIRTVYRDIRALEQSGIPIVTEEGRGYSIMDGYKLPPIMFSEEEALALVTAEQLIKKNTDQSLTEFYESAVTKIRAVLQSRQQTTTEFLASRLQVRGTQDQEGFSRYLIQLQSTIANFQLVEIEYQSLSDHHSRRKLEPFAVYTTKGNWILVAFCRLKKAFRAFRLDRIQSLHITGEYFEPHDMTLEQYLEQCRQTWKNTPDTQLSAADARFAADQIDSKMQIEIIEPFKLIGIAVRTTNENQQAAQDIGGLWGQFMSENLLQKIPNRIDDTIYSLYTDYEGDHTQPYTAILGCRVESLDEVPAGMVGRSFDGGRYAKTTATGDLAQGLIVNHWLKIWETQIDRAFTADFEVFGEKASDPSNAEVDFYVAVGNAPAKN